MGNVPGDPGLADELSGRLAFPCRTTEAGERVSRTRTSYSHSYSAVLLSFPACPLLSHAPAMIFTVVVGEGGRDAAALDRDPGAHGAAGVLSLNPPRRSGSETCALSKRRRAVKVIRGFAPGVVLTPPPAATSRKREAGAGMAVTAEADARITGTSPRVDTPKPSWRNPTSLASLAV